MDASQLPKGKSLERNSETPVNEPGTYKHKDTGAVFITAEGEAGTVQADALMTERWKDAWEWVGEVPNRTELLKMRKVQELKDAKEEAAQKKADEAKIAAAVADVTEEVKLPAGGATYEPALAK